MRDVRATDDSAPCGWEKAQDCSINVDEAGSLYRKSETAFLTTKNNIDISFDG
jgi:hypothetical protein